MPFYKKEIIITKKEIVNYYRRYKSRKTNYPWCYISPSIGICMSLVDDRPIFLNIIAAELEYDDAKNIYDNRLDKYLSEFNLDISLFFIYKINNW